MSAKITDLAKRYRDLEQKSKAQAEVLKTINAEWTDVENKLLESFVEDGVNSVRLEGLGLFSMSTTNYLSVTAANKELYFEYLKTSGNDGLLKLDINPKTNGAFLDTHLETLIAQGEESGLNKIEARTKALEFLAKNGVSYFTKKGISVRKA